MTFRIRTRWYLLLLCGLVVANVVLYKGIVTPPELSVTVFPNAGAPVALVRLPEGGAVLVNAGPDASILRELGTTLPEWQRALDALVLTSGNAKAAGGAPMLLARYHVSKVLRFGALGARTTEIALAAAEQESAAQSGLPYGSPLWLAPAVMLRVRTLDALTLSVGTRAFNLSSTTPPGTYRFSKQ